MKKLSIFIAILFAVATASAQYDCLQDTIYYYHYDPGTTTKIYDSRIITTFSTSGKPTQQLNQSWNFAISTWINIDKLEMQYNTANLLTQQVNFAWNTSSSSWLNQTRYQNAYTTAGMKTEELTENWNTSTNSWVGYNRFVYQYNSNNKEVNQQYFIWDAPTTAWVNIQNRVRTYSGNNLMNESINYRTSASNPWETTYYTQWLYNSKGKITEVVYQNNPSGTLANFQRRTYAYNSTDTLVSEEISQNWNTTSTSWDNSLRLLNTYNTNGTKATFISQTWNVPTASWLNDFKQNFYYNTANRITEEMWENWNTATNTWINDSRITRAFNTSQNPTEEISYTWDTGISGYIAISRNTFLYNTAQKQTERRGQQWNAILGNWSESNLDLRQYNSYGHQIVRESFTAWDNILGYYLNSNCERNSCRLQPNGIEESDANEISIYPNPIQGNMFTVIVAEKGELALYNIKGQLIDSQQVERSENFINFPQLLQSGVYFVKIGNSVQKLIKE